MIRKESSAGVGYSVVSLNGVNHVFAAAVPRQGTTLAQQAHDALRTIEAINREEGTHGSIVQQAVFLRDISELDECRQIIREFYGPDLPATSYVLQPPCEDKLLSIEALGVGRGGLVEVDRLGERLVITRHDRITWYHLAHIAVEREFAGVYDRAMAVFRTAEQTLARHGVGFDQVIRTWIYLGDIIGPEGNTQRYKELNRARTDFYQGRQFCAGHLPPGWNRTVYPASTGIGTTGKDLVFSCIALATDRDDITLLPMENPRQTSACDYPIQYGPQSPKFSRAMSVLSRTHATILVSGTASITASETREVDNAERQTAQTLDNIAALISEENFAEHGAAGFGATLQDLALVRVYVKRQEDYPRVRAVCEARLGEVPTIYAVADVCRPELLVEIEGIAFSRKRS